MVHANLSINNRETIDTLKVKIKNPSSLVIQTNLDLHDLSETLPADGEHTREVAAKTGLNCQKLAEGRKKPAVMGA
jgi:hypothetical protein